MIDMVEILTHWYAGRSQNELAAQLGGGPQDAAQVHRPGGRGRASAPGGPPMAEADWRTAGGGVVPGAG
mgnify:CR=1 FL=1